MRRFIPCFAIAAVAAGLSLSARADALDDKFKPLIPDKYAADFMKKALDGIHYLNCDGFPCRPTDEFEQLNPPLSVEDTRQVMVYSIKGALAWWCGLDEGRGVLALEEFTEERGYNPRQTALSNAVHGTFMRMQKAVYEGSGKTCDDATKAELDGSLPKGLK